MKLPSAPSSTPRRPGPRVHPTAPAGCWRDAVGEQGADGEAAASGVRVRVGAMQFTRTLGASSTARSVKPSTAALTLPMTAWPRNARRDAGVEHDGAASRGKAGSAA